MSRVGELRDARELWLRAADERDALSASLSEMVERLEEQRDRAAAAWSLVDVWRGCSEAAQAALGEERRERNALIRLEVDRLTERPLPKRRGRPPSFRPEKEADLEEKHRVAKVSIRQLAADHSMSPTAVYRVVSRVRRQRPRRQNSAGWSRSARGARRHSRRRPGQGQKRERQKAQDYDPVRADRYLEDLRNG